MWLLVLAVLSQAPGGAQAGCAREPVAQVGPVPVWRVPGTAALVYESGLAIDADGAPDAYHPDGQGLDHLANAGKPGNWWGVVTDTGKSSGTPVVQGPSDPEPGYYVSSTSLQDTSKAVTDPRRYVDSNLVPYLAISPRLLGKSLPGGVKLGDVAAVVNTSNGKVAYAVVADVGPKDKLGEGSIALADALGIRSNPKRGGAVKGVVYVVFPGSSAGWPRTSEEIAGDGERLFKAWGGVARVQQCRAG